MRQADIGKVVDSSLEGRYDINSILKVIDIVPAQMPVLLVNGGLYSERGPECILVALQSDLARGATQSGVLDLVLAKQHLAMSSES
ncbi:hypothetical protein GW17_00025730 [Ensete ventricosum]|nr:hypothetical protein GW17_00025730 [Ensete ventricosum]